MRRWLRVIHAMLATALLILLGCSSRSKDAGTRHMSDGEDAIARGQIRRAIVCYEKEIELNPTNPAPHLRLALIYELIEGEQDKAASYYDRFLELEPNEGKRARVNQWRDDLGETVEFFPIGTAGNNGAADPASFIALKRELENMRFKLHEAQESNETFANKILELEGVHQKLESSRLSIAQLETQARDLAKQIEAKDRSLTALQQELDTLKTTHDQTARESADTLAGLQRELDEVTQQRQELELEQSRAGRRELSKKLDETREALKDAQEQNAAAAQQIEALQMRIAQLEAQQGASGTDTRRMVRHVIQKGETLGTIAEKYYGTRERWVDIHKANLDTIPDPNRIQPGQEIIVPLDNAP